MADTKMYSFDKEATKLSHFLDAVWDKKLWIATTALFCFAIRFVYTNYHEMPAEYLRHVHISIDAGRSIEEGQMIQDVFKTQGTCLAGFGPFLDFYKKHFDGKAVTETIAPNIYLEAMTRLSQLRKDIALQVGRLGGMSFHDKDYQAFVNDTAQGLGNFDRLLVAFQTFITAHATNTRTDKTTKSSDIELQYNETLTRMTASIESWTTRLTANTKSETVDIVQATSDFERLMLRAFLNLAAMAYILVWLCFAIRAYFRSRQTPSKLFLPSHTA